ncbi:MAG: TolB family protein [Chloroflexota bacterium]
MHWSPRALAAVYLAASVSLGVVPQFGRPQLQASDSRLLAVVGRQVAWLNLDAPRHTPVSRFAATSNALSLTAQPDASHVVVAVGAAFTGGGPRGADLVNLDVNSGDSSPLFERADPHESLNSPAWWPDHATLLFERQDLAGRPVGAPGQEVPRYPSRIERVMSDGSGRGILVPDGRQPSAAPDGTRLVFARTTNQGASLLIWTQADGSVQTLVPEGRFADAAYPQFSPRNDQIAFVAPQSGINGGPDREVQPLALDALFSGVFGPDVAYAHGIPWDPWIINADGSGLRRVAETDGDEPSVAWSPDQTQLFVYGGTGSFVVDAASGGLTPLKFVAGYGPIVWL